jgi:ABC-2 type transport system ATP-binding protein
MEPAAVATEDLVKRYPSTLALGGVSLSIAAGEIFALLGPNGAGKTTWISIVCGLCRATSGSALVLGRDVVRDAMAARRLVGLVPQELNFDPFFTPRQVLRFQMGYFGVRRDEARILDLLTALDLAGKADANTRELSGGMKRRLLIAKSLVHRPRVLFLDEPTAGVDLNLRRDLWQYVRTLRAEGTTVVLTTHYLEEAEELADRVAVIDHGRLLTVDTKRALMAKYGRKRVRFVFSRPVTPNDRLRDLGALLDDDGRRLTCPVGDEGVAPLLAAAAALGSIVDLTTEEPSLEQVFVALTERSAA